MINLFPVRSSMLAAAGYDPDVHIMVVLYNSGKAYEYHQVPPEIFWGLMSSESVGRFMNEHVLGAFPFKVFHGWEQMQEEELHYGRWDRSHPIRIRRAPMR